MIVELLVWKTPKVKLLVRHRLLHFADLEVMTVSFMPVTRSVNNQCFCLIQNTRRRTKTFWKMHWLALKDRSVNNQRRLLCLYFSVLIKSLEMTRCLLRNLYYVLVDNTCLTKSFCIDALCFRLVH